MRFYRPNGGMCEVGETALAMIARHIQRDRLATEAGGVLIGRLVAGTDDVVIDLATNPSPKDRRGRFFFFRLREHAQDRVNEAWVRSGGTSVYLGEWHTHPEDEPVPSPTDIANWQNIVRTATFEQSFLLFLIAGRLNWRLWELAIGSDMPNPLGTEPICRP